MTDVSTQCAVDSHDYKQAMRHLVGGTCVISAEYEGEKSGLTVTSVTSVAAEPPELLVCINQTASAWPLIEKSGCFGVNVLATEQQHIALQFAGVGGMKGAQRYENASWYQHNGIWLLEHAPAVFACRIDEIIVRHSHALVLARVEKLHYLAPQSSPLVYWNGQFSQLQV